MRKRQCNAKSAKTRTPVDAVSPSLSLPHISVSFALFVFYGKVNFHLIEMKYI